MNLLILKRGAKLYWKYHRKKSENFES